MPCSHFHSLFFTWTSNRPLCIIPWELFCELCLYGMDSNENDIRDTPLFSNLERTHMHLEHALLVLDFHKSCNILLIHHRMYPYLINHFSVLSRRGCHCHTSDFAGLVGCFYWWAHMIANEVYRHYVDGVKYILSNKLNLLVVWIRLDPVNVPKCKMTLTQRSLKSS